MGPFNETESNEGKRETREGKKTTERGGYERETVVPKVRKAFGKNSIQNRDVQGQS